MATDGAALRILVVGDDPLARNGLAMLLSTEPGLIVAGQIPATEDLGVAAQLYRPDAVVWDLGMPAAAGTDRLRDLAPSGLPAVVLLPDEESAPDAYAAGARGLLFRDAEPARIAAALRSLAQGLVALDEVVAAALVRPRATALSPLPEALTPRELEVLQLLSLGLSNKAIADQLIISEHTAKFHVNAILSKLGAQSRTEGVVRAARLGLVVL